MEKLPLRCFVSAAAIVITVVHHRWPGFKPDAFTVTFLIVALLPWLTPLLKTIELPGGFKVELRELREELAQTKGEVQSVAIQAKVGAAALDAGRPQQFIEAEVSKRLIALATKYEEIRNAMPSGPARTEAMTRLVAEMLQEAAQASSVDVALYLGSASRGERLVGAICVHARPSQIYLDPLVQTLVEREDTPFGQYWLLRALRRIAEVDRTAFATKHLEKLRKFKDRQKPGTDRDYEITQLLRDLSVTVTGRQ